MPDTNVLTASPDQDQVATYDAIVIGAGISGMYMLYRLRELGLTAKVFEAGTDIGGTCTGTVILVPASIPKAGRTAIPFPRNSGKSGTGRSIFLRSPIRWNI